jgi:hypothetical protein
VTEEERYKETITRKALKSYTSTEIEEALADAKATENSALVFGSSAVGVLMAGFDQYKLVTCPRTVYSGRLGTARGVEVYMDLYFEPREKVLGPYEVKLVQMV